MEQAEAKEEAKASVTLVTAWYELGAKFSPEQYRSWGQALMGLDCPIILFTDERTRDSLSYLEMASHITIVKKELDTFLTYSLGAGQGQAWIDNHSRNALLKDRVSWQTNMLWSEKINFVSEAVALDMARESPSDWYIWCDFGYFRGRPGLDLCGPELLGWPSKGALALFDGSKVHYGQVCPTDIMDLLRVRVIRRPDRLPVYELPPHICTIAGGFFAATPATLRRWHETYYAKLDTYFRNDYLVKDDQVIILDCVLETPELFALHTETHASYDTWFMFQRILKR